MLSRHPTHQDSIGAPTRNPRRSPDITPEWLLAIRAYWAGLLAQREAEQRDAERRDIAS